jgi:hypothetical protein
VIENDGRPWGLEPQTSTVSKGRYYVVPTTWKAFRTPLVRGNAAKPDLLQVKLQVKNSSRTAPTICEAQVILFCPALSDSNRSAVRWQGNRLGSSNGGLPSKHNVDSRKK